MYNKPIQLTAMGRGNNRGFTLIELMVALLIAMFFISATVMIIQFSTRSYRAQERVADVQQELRACLDYLVRDFRMIGADPMRVANPQILTKDADKIEFQYDRNMSGAIDPGQQEHITYTFDGNTLSRITDANPPEPLISNLSAVTFEYFDKNGAAAATAYEVVSVGISLTRQDRDAKGGTFDRTLSTTVKLRNAGL